MPPSPTVPAHRPLAGIVLLILSCWALNALDASGKWVMAAGLSVGAVAWMRYALHLVLVLALAVPTRGWRILRSQRPRAQILRAAFMLVATLCFFKTLTYLPLAEAIAINFITPLIMLSLAPWLLGEPSRPSRWVAAAAGLIGVLIIVRPSAGLPLPGVVFGLLTALCFALQHIITRRLAGENPLTTLIWSGAIGTVALSAALPLTLADTLTQLGDMSPLVWLIWMSTGFWGCLGHLLQIQAYRAAPASLLAPFIYLQIVSASAIGWLVWGQFPDAVTWVGIGIICASGIFIALLEWRRPAA